MNCGYEDLLTILYHINIFVIFVLSLSRLIFFMFYFYIYFPTGYFILILYLSICRKCLICKEISEVVSSALIFTESKILVWVNIHSIFQIDNILCNTDIKERMKIFKIIKIIISKYLYLKNMFSFCYFSIDKSLLSRFWIDNNSSKYGALNFWNTIRRKEFIWAKRQEIVYK